MSNPTITEQISNRTSDALEDHVIEQFQKLQFCVVGCGGTGALFAEMLVRTGAKKIVLVDGAKVKASNLNRVLGFSWNDLNQKKVDVLKSRFNKINPEISIDTIGCHLREYDADDSTGKQARNSIHDSDVVIMSMDNNKDRIKCEKLCQNNSSIRTLGIGVYIHTDGNSGFEVAWRGKTPPEKIEEEGYGVGSYVSIVVEATAVAFTMLLHHLKMPNSSKYSYFEKHHKNYLPTVISRQ